jgi:hypothetical protein
MADEGASVEGADAIVLGTEPKRQGDVLVEANRIVQTFVVALRVVEDDDVQVPVFEKDCCVGQADKLTFSVLLVDDLQHPWDDARHDANEAIQNGAPLIQRARLLNFSGVDCLLKNGRLADCEGSVFPDLAVLVKLPCGRVHKHHELK